MLKQIMINEQINDKLKKILIAENVKDVKSLIKKIIYDNYQTFPSKLSFVYSIENGIDQLFDFGLIMASRKCCVYSINIEDNIIESVKNYADNIGISTLEYVRFLIYKFIYEENSDSENHKKICCDTNDIMDFFTLKKDACKIIHNCYISLALKEEVKSKCGTRIKFTKLGQFIRFYFNFVNYPDSSAIKNQTVCPYEIKVQERVVFASESDYRQNRKFDLEKNLKKFWELKGAYI